MGGWTDDSEYVVSLIHHHSENQEARFLPFFASLSGLTASERNKTAHHITMVIREWEGNGIINVVKPEFLVLINIGSVQPKPNDNNYYHMLLC